MAINIQNMCGNGGSGGQAGGGAVNAVNGVAPGANGNVQLTADNLGAALAATNIRSVTKRYRRFISQEGNEDVTPKDYLWQLGKGSFFLRAADGVHFVACVDLMGSIAARVYAHLPNITDADGDVIDGGVYIADTKLVAFDSTEDIQQLIFKIGDSPIATEQFVASALELYVTDTQLTNALKGKVTPAGARNIAKDEFIKTLPLTAIGGTWLEKNKEQGITRIRVHLGCQEWLQSNFAWFESLELVLYICHRKHGRKYHWRHPLNYNEESPDPELNKAGYAAIEGMARDPHEHPDEVFPAVPSWMPHGGYMQTTIKISREDVIRGYIDIDPGFYFLPMLKPVDLSKKFYGENIEFMGVQPTGLIDHRRHMPILCTWGILVDGKAIGKPRSVLRIGISRLKKATKLKNDVYVKPGYTRLVQPYLKID